LITLRNLTLARGARVLATGVDIALHAGERIGVVGANGCGKSSLLELLAGEMHPEAGDLELPQGLAIARVLQETPGVEQPAIEYVLDGDAELRAVQSALANAEKHAEGAEIGALHERLDGIGGYGARSRAAALLHGLGFASAQHESPVASFSGGWRMRLNLARALIARSDLLLLDEPTNHLDLDAVMWLERWLLGYNGTLLLVSHDRDFLDATVKRILHFDAGRIVAYSGNYSAFEEARAQAFARQQAAYAKQQREIAHLHAYIERFRAKATKARQAQSRMKALARMETIAPAHVDSEFTFCFEPAAAAPSPLIKLEDATAGYGGTAVLRDVSATLLPGSRIGLLGRNGTGKSTLVKLLAGDVPPMSGTRIAGRGLAVGYFAQHQLEQLRPDESPLWHITRLDPGAREQDLRDFLGRFGFGGEQALVPCGPFSGGERSRLALALVVRRRPNLLLLDEPTNHLDLEMRHALTLALQEYEGAVVLVSHDRHTLKTTADDLWLVADGQVQPFDGDLDDYRAWLERDAAGDGEGQREELRASRKDERRERARRQDELAARRKPLETEVRSLERAIATLGGEIAAIDGKLAAAATYSANGGGDIGMLNKRRAEVQSQVEAAETRWYALQEQLEVIPRE